MIIYNITSKIDHEIVHEWVQWQKDEHIPEAMSTGLFYEHGFFRLLGQDEAGGETYIVQFYARDIDVCETYIQLHSEKLREGQIEKWGNKFISFYSILEAVQ